MSKQTQEINMAGDEKEETADYADYTDFFVFFRVFRVFRGSFSWYPVMTAGAVTLRRMKTDTNEFAQHIGCPRRGSAGGKEND